MCVVVPAVIGTIASVASSAVGYIGQQQAANQQAAYNQTVYNQQVQQAQAQAEFQNQQVEAQNEYILQNRDNAVAALQLDREALVAQERQESIAVGLDIEQKRIEALKARGALQASGRVGLTLDTMLSDFYRQEAQYINTSRNNLAFTSGQRVREQAKLTAAAQSRINEARGFQQAPVQTPFAPAPVSRPSLLGAAISTGTTVMNQFSARQVYDPYQQRFRRAGQQVSQQSTPQSSIGSAGLAPTRFSQGDKRFKTRVN